MSFVLKFLFNHLVSQKTTQLKSYIALYLFKEFLYEKGYLKAKSFQGLKKIQIINNV